nr:sodium-dependent transporter [uncultured Moraxella sp.]
MSTNHKSSHSQWSSKIGFLMAAVGSAVGLGSIWKFPYMTGDSGGSAFVIVFIISIALIGFPVLVTEWLIGRRGQSNPAASFRKAAVANNTSPAWSLLGYFGILAAFMILSFYSVIGGWSLNYTLKAGINAFGGLNADATGKIFETMLANPTEMTLWHTAFMGLTALIVAGGVSAGIEKASKIMMPALAFILLFIVGYNAINMDFAKGAEFLFKFDWQRMQEVGVGKVLMAALGHAFFCLSLGMAIMVSYGSYLKQDVDLLATARTVIIWDIIFSLAAGLAIFPILFSNHLDPAAGPGLVFVTLPIAFGQMSLGVVVGTLFFLLLTFAALTSSISILEPIVEFLEEKTPMSRKLCTLVGAVSTWAVGILALLSFNKLSDFAVFTIHKNGKDIPQGIFDALDYTSSKIMLPLIGLGTIILIGWFMNQESVKRELGLDGMKWTIWQIVVKFVAPIGIIAVFLTELLG